MATNHDRLFFKIFRFIEGEAQGRFAITALVIIVALMFLALTMQ